MLNRYEHEDAEPLMGSVREALPAISSAVRSAQEQETAVVYVNDNHGDWAAGREALCDWALMGPHADLVAPVVPPPEAAFVTKARHTIFYETSLDYLLHSSGVERIVLTGQVTEQCILYSALDAYVRHYDVLVASDAVAHIHPDLAQAALRMMEVNMGAAIAPAEELIEAAAR